MVDRGVLMMFILADVCDDLDILKMILLGKNFLDVARILVPVILIVVMTIDIMKVVLNPVKESKGITKIVINRLSAAVAFFLVFTFVDITMSLTGEPDNTTTNSSCWINANIDNVKRLQAEYDRIAAEKWAELNKPSEQPDTTPVPSTGDNSKFIKFLKGLEGSSPPYCDSAKTLYKARDENDGTITIGYGVTNVISDSAEKLGYGQYFPMKKGDCVPVKVIDDIFAYEMKKREKAVRKQLSELNITGWSQNKVDAMTSFDYQSGWSGRDKVIGFYAKANFSDAVLWDHFKLYVKSGDVIFAGLYARRDDEYDLYLTGDYNPYQTFYDCKYQYYKTSEIVGTKCKF